MITVCKRYGTLAAPFVHIDFPNYLTKAWSKLTIPRTLPPKSSCNIKFPYCVHHFPYDNSQNLNIFTSCTYSLIHPQHIYPPFVTSKFVIYKNRIFEYWFSHQHSYFLHYILLQIKYVHNSFVPLPEMRSKLVTFCHSMVSKTKEFISPISWSCMSILKGSETVITKLAFAHANFIRYTCHYIKTAETTLPI